MGIEELRVAIDQIDKELMALLEKRLGVAYDVAKYKYETKKNIKDENREKLLKDQNLAMIEEEALRDKVKPILDAILESSRAIQKEWIDNELISDNKLVVGFQGVEGSYSHEATMKYFADTIKTECYDTFDEVFTAIDKGEIAYGVVPIENSSTGAISQVYELQLAHGAHIVGETFVRVNHNLMVHPDTNVDDIKKVYSHPQGFQQSTTFLKGKEWEQVAYFNTAMSAKYVSEHPGEPLACIASEKAGEFYGLKSIAININNNEANTTRFAIISNEMDANQSHNRISMVFTTLHRAGALYTVLGTFANSGISLQKIESRPIPHTPWEYYFYVDIEGEISDPLVARTLEKIKEECQFFKILGIFESKKD